MTTAHDRHGRSSPVTGVGGLDIPPVTITTAPNVAHPPSRIRSICEHAWRARGERRLLSLELTTCSSLDIVHKDDGLPHSYDRSISLADFLMRAAGDEDVRFSMNDQALLGLNIASSVLQLRPTMWCREPWNSTTIKFPVGTANGARPVLDTPYLEQYIEPAMTGRQGMVSPELTIETLRSSLLELAILLLEIFNHRSIANWAARNGHGETTTSSGRELVAELWATESQAKLLEGYHDAVAACLMLYRQRRPWDEFFQRLYVRNVIQPLREIPLPEAPRNLCHGYE